MIVLLAIISLSGCTASADATAADPATTYPLILVGFFVVCVLMMRATVELARATQVLAAALVRVIAAMVVFAVMVGVIGGGLMLVTWAAFS